MGLSYEEVCRLRSRYAMAEQRYVTDPGTTLQSVAAEFGLRLSGVRRYAQRHGWRRKREEYQQRLHDKVADRLADQLASMTQLHLMTVSSVVERVIPIVEARIPELGPADAWRVLKEAMEMQRRIVGMDELIKRKTQEVISNVLDAAEAVLPPEEFGRLRDAVIAAGGAPEEGAVVAEDVGAN